jgi:hypothetical protein
LSYCRVAKALSTGIARYTEQVNQLSRKEPDMSRVDTYRHLEKDQPLTLTLPMDDLAKQLVALNYGVHRMLSSLVRELRVAQAQRAAEYATRHPGEENAYGPSPLADGLEKLLNDGHFS